MRKEFVYSFAALGAIPVTVNAAEVGAFKANAQTINDATPIELNVGSLPKGNYKLFSSEITTTNTLTTPELKITVNGVTKTFKAGEKASIDFKLTEAASVIVILEGDGSNFVIDPQINLDFDFAAQGAALKELLTKAVAGVNAYEYTTKNDDIVAINASAGTLIETIINNPTFDIYKENQLWLDAEQTPIAKTISDWTIACQEKEAQYQHDVITAGAAKVEAALAAAKAKIQDNVVAAADTKALSDKETVINKLIAQYKKDGLNIDAIEIAIEEYEDLVTIANGNGDANDAAYAAVKDKIDAAKANYTASNKELQTYLNGDNYADLRSEALTALSTALQDITPINVNNEAYHNAGTSVANQATLVGSVETFNTNLNNIVTEYKGYGDVITDAYKVVATQQAALDKAAEDNKDAVANEQATQDAKAAAQQLIDNLKKKIVDNDTKATVENIAVIDASEIETAIAKIGTVAANYNAYQGFLKNIADFETIRDNAIKALNDFVAEDETLSADGYAPETYWAKLISNVNGTAGSNKNDIEGAKNKAKDAYEKGTATTNKDVWVALDKAAEKLVRLMKTGESIQMTVGNSNINRAGNNEAYACADKYKNMKEAAVDYQKDLDELNGLVKNLDIYTATFEKDGLEVGNYKAKIDAIQKRIDAMTQALKDSKDNSKTEASSDEGNYYTYMTTTFPAIDETIKTDIAALKTTYAQDQQEWEADNLAKTIEQMSDAVTAKKAALNEDVAAIEAMDLGNSAEEINAELATIKTAIADIDVEKAAKDETQPITELSALSAKCDELSKQLTTLKATATAAAEKVATNKTNKATADKAVSDLKDKLTTQQTYVAANYADVAANYDADFAKVNDEITKIEAAIATAFGKEELTAEDYSAGVTTQNKAIDDIVAKAKAAQENYTANVNILAEYVKVETAYNNALAAAQASDDAATKGYYAETRLAKDLKGQLDTYKKNIDDNYAAGKSASIEANIKAQLATLKSDIEGVAAAAKANADAYAAQQDVLKEAQSEWNRVYLKISSQDESSKKDEYLAQLNGYNETLLDIELNQIDENYNNGKSASIDLSTTINGIIGAIKSVEAAQEANYDATITADNKKMYEETIPAAKKEATDAYTFAVNTMTAYQDAQSDELQAALATVTEQSTTLTAALRDFNKNIQEEQETIDKKYKETTSPATFNKDDSEGYIRYFKDQQTAIEDALAAFQDAINAVIGADLAAAIDNYGTTIADAKAVVTGYLKDANSKIKDSEVTAQLNTLFNDADDMKADLDDALKNNDIKALDNALVKAANETSGIAASVAAVKEAQAKITLDQLLSAVETEQDWLSDGSKTTLENLKKNYNSYISKKALSANYATVKADIDNLADEIATAKASDAAYDTILAEIVDLQKALDEAVAVAEQFTIAKAFKENNLKQADVDNLKTELEDYKEAHTAAVNQKAIEQKIADKKAAFEAAVKDIVWNKTTKKAEYSTLLTAELAQLKTDLAAINEQYVIYAADYETEGVQEKAAEYKTQIDAITDKVNVDLSKLTDKTYTNYSNANVLALEKEMASLLTELTTLNNADKNTRLNNELNETISTLNSDLAAATEGKDASVIEELAEQIQAIQDAINKQAAEVEAKKDNMVYYAEDIKAELEGIPALIEQLAADANALQKVIDDKKAAAQAAYDAVVAVYDAAQEAIDKVKADIDEKFAPYASSSDFNNKFKQMENVIKTNKEALDIDNLADDALKTANDIKDKQAATLLDLQNTAANKAQNARLAELEAEAAKITYTASLYTIGDQKSLKNQKDAIDAAIVAAEAAIAKALTAEAGNDQPYNKNEDIQAAMDEIKAKIDALNKDIKDLIVAPEGDANQDGSVNGLDIQTVINGIVEGSNDYNLDINGDNKVNGLDIQSIINIIVGK